MAKVLGIGGIFFKSEDPVALGEWYKKHLGVPVEAPYGASFKPSSLPAGSMGVWTPFKATTDYFAPSTQPFMFNLIVDDLDAALLQVTGGGAEIVGDIEDIEYGRFGWFIDPDGNKVELWEPKVFEESDS